MVHRIVQFDHQPNAADLAALVADGYTIAAAIPDNALLVSGRRPIRQPGVIWQGLLLESDKISPAISESRDFVLHVLVDFHSDVEPEAQNALGAALGFDFVRLNFLLPNHVLVDATLPELQLLARRDEVAYISSRRIPTGRVFRFRQTRRSPAPACSRSPDPSPNMRTRCMVGTSTPTTSHTLAITSVA